MSISNPPPPPPPFRDGMLLNRRVTLGRKFAVPTFHGETCFIHDQTNHASGKCEHTTVVPTQTSLSRRDQSVIFFSRFFIEKKKWYFTYVPDLY